MNKAIFAFVIAALVSGCTTTMKGGSGQLFQLSDRHVIYRDLTVPVGLGNEPVKQNADRMPSAAP